MITLVEFDSVRQYIYNAIHIVNIASERMAELIEKVKSEKIDMQGKDGIIADLISMNTEFEQLMETVQEVKRRLDELDIVMNVNVKEWKSGK